MAPRGRPRKTHPDTVLDAVPVDDIIIPRRKAGQKYSPAEMEHALQVCAWRGGNTYAAAERLGIPNNTLIGWWDKLTDDEKQERIQAVTKHAADNFREIVVRGSAEIAKRIPGMADKDLVIATGVATDKLHIIEGKPTSIVETRSVDEMMTELARIEQDVRERKAKDASAAKAKVSTGQDTRR